MIQSAAAVQERTPVGALKLGPDGFNKIAILGTAPSSMALAPFKDPAWSIWACSPGAFPICADNGHAPRRERCRHRCRSDRAAAGTEAFDLHAQIARADEVIVRVKGEPAPLDAGEKLGSESL